MYKLSKNFRFETDTVKLAERIKEIQEVFTIEELTETMPYTTEQITDYNTLVDFDWNTFSKQPEQEEPGSETKDINLQFVELKLNLTKEVFSLWEEYKTRIKNNLNDQNLSDNKCFEFAIAEALSTIKEGQDE